MGFNTPVHAIVQRYLQDMVCASRFVDASSGVVRAGPSEDGSGTLVHALSSSMHAAKAIGALLDFVQERPNVMHTGLLTTAVTMDHVVDWNLD